jgi:hypothetical protein
MTSGQTRFPIAPSMFRFRARQRRRRRCGSANCCRTSAASPHELCIVRSMHTEAINHEPAITFVQTGTQQPGRPSFGSWASYGLGTENRDLPTFVVLITQGFGNMQALAARFWGNGFLPSEHQGCKLRSSGDPVLFLQDPRVCSAWTAAPCSTWSANSTAAFARSLDPEIEARIAQQEMAFRMQTSVPELVDLANEPASTWALYGEEAKKPGTFASSCLLARRLCERGVRFVQLYMRGWDQHGNLPAETAHCSARRSTGRSRRC